MRHRDLIGVPQKVEELCKVYSQLGYKILSDKLKIDERKSTLEEQKIKNGKSSISVI
jgi:hypothetical protein